MKNKKIIAIIMIITVIVLGMIFGIFHLVNSIKKDTEQAQLQMEEINVLYESLNKNAELFNLKKTEFDDLMDNIYYTTIPTQNESLLKIVKEYDEIIANIQKDGNDLEEKCSIYYTDSDIQQKCTSYKISYESAMTIFIADLKRYNNLVENYNNWTEDNTGYKKISSYVSKNVE